MRTLGTPSPDSRELRRYLRDLAALTALSAIWNGAERRHLAESLADVLVKVLYPDFVYVRLKGSGGEGPVEAVRTGQGPDAPERDQAIRRALEPCLPCDTAAATVLPLPHPFADGLVQAALTPIGYGCEFGVLVAASGQPGFPTEEDLLLLGVAANQAAAVLQCRQAEAELRRSEQELADFFDNAPVGLHWEGPDGTILRVNQAELDLLGYTRSEYLGHHVAEFHADRQACEDILRRLHGAEELHGHEARLRCKDGSIKHVLIDSNVKWEDGRFVHTRCFTRDITDQRRAEQTVRFLAGAAGADFTCVARFNGQQARLESASEGFTRVTGYTVEEFNARVGAFAVHPDDILGLLQGLEGLTRGEAVCGEVRAVAKGGAVRWLRYLAEPSFEPGEPQVLRIRGAAQDITERKAASEREQEAERRFRQLAEHINEVFWMSDPLRTHILYCSPAYEEVWGRSCESLYQQPWSWLDSVVPEDRDRFVATLKGQGRGEPTDVEYRINRADGSVRWVRERSFPVKEPTGQEFRVAGVADDITDRKRAEEAQGLLAAIVASSEDAIVSKTLDGVITSWNVGAERLFGYTAAEAVGRPITLIIPPERRDEEHMILERLRRGERIEHFETVRQSRQGRRFDISLTVSPVRDGSGRVIGASKVARDITARKEAEKALREADRHKDEFLAMLAHELRNPLAPVRNAVQILRAKGPPVPELQWARDVIDRQVQQMTRLVDDLLDVSRLTRGKIELRKERTALAAVVGSAVEASRPLIEKWGHELTVTLPPEPIELDVDPTRLAQVLSNLLNNAAKYTDPGGRIGLTAEREGGAVLLRVTDNGIGIPAAMLPRVFELFTQVDRSLERSQGGLGIGLTLVQRLVEMHGGTVAAYSDGPGAGSTFVVRLPLPGEQGLRPEGPAGAGEPVPAAAAWRILVVDDNKDAADSLGMLLRLLGNEVRTAHDGLEAVAAAAAFRPDVVLLDIGLPKLNGYEAARRIRAARGADVVLIAVTGWGQAEDRRRSREAGFDHHLTKPVEFDALQQLLAATTPGRPAPC